jgi:putative transcriptional regulator
MIRVLLKQQLDDLCFKEKRRITLNEVSDVTGISRATLTRIANNPGYNCNTDAINALCKYFSCTPCELLTYIPDSEAAE